MEDGQECSAAKEAKWGIYGYSGRRYFKTKEKTSLRIQRVGGAQNRCRLPAEMYRMRTPDYDCTQTGGEEREGDYTQSSAHVGESILIHASMVSLFSAAWLNCRKKVLACGCKI